MQTKLYTPRLRPSFVPRPHLIQKLNQGLHRKLTLISAPAGFGKTTCISEWIHTLDYPATWLSLDNGDDDPRRFVTYFIAALQKVDMTLGQDSEDLLSAGQLSPAEIISTTLINNMLALADHFLLVLDDFHVIQDRFILQFLENLIANIPPPLHLVLITREDPPLPLARLRANNLLTEIRARDLRFNTHDTAIFLETLGLSLSPKDIAALEKKSEGWIVGLQLAGIALQSSLSVQNESDPSAFIAQLSGSHRFFLSYLTEQVLDQQSEEMRQFLLQTAILDKLHGDLCNAVTERTDGRFLLERLFNANLFLIPLDDEGEWYRYHHLFRDLLRDRQHVLRGEETAVLHQRASQWYVQANMINMAIHHALAAQDYEMAVDLLESYAMQMIMQGFVKTVNGWVEAIPERWRSQSPRTNLAFAWMHLLRGAYPQASPYLEQLHATLDNDPILQQTEAETSLKADWLVMQSLVLYMEGKLAESKSKAEHALAIVPEQDDRVRSLAYYALGSVCQASLEFDRAVHFYQLAIQYGRAAENLVAEMMSMTNLAMIALEHGKLHLAYEIAAPIDERNEQSGSLPPMSAVVYGVLGELFIQWYQLDRARQYTQRSLQLSRFGGYNTAVVLGHVTLSRLAQIEGDLEAALEEIQTAVNLLPVELPEYIRQEVTAQQVNLYLACNRPAAAELALRRQGFSFQDQFIFPDFPSEQAISHSLGLLYNSSLRYLLNLAKNGRTPDKLKAGIDLANRLITATLQSQKTLVALTTYLLRAQMYAACGEIQASHSDYVNALELAETEGFIGVFVEQGQPVAHALTQSRQFGRVSKGYINNILAAFTHLQSPSTIDQVSFLVEPLSERELEVLRLMADGLKYKEIATQLFISLNTVRYHVKALYGKLNVNNRTQAISAARQLELL
ncbi:MAG: hypothetical protein IAF02_10790 [Anaerolineae bacterium]|nr:hypothetical protein [Anaerolineae bacterium]